MEIIKKKELIDNSLEHYCNDNNITYILVESAGQNDIIDIKERIEVIKLIYNNLVV